MKLKRFQVSITWTELKNKTKYHAFGNDALILCESMSLNSICMTTIARFADYLDEKPDYQEIF